MVQPDPSCPAPGSRPPVPAVPDYGEVARKMGMSQKCVDVAMNKNTESSSSSQVGVSLPIYSAGITSNQKNSEIDLSMYQDGCGKMGFTAETLNHEEANLTCNMNSTLSEQATTFHGGASLKIELIPPLESTIAWIGTESALMAQAIVDITNSINQIPYPNYPISPFATDRLYQYIFLMYQTKVAVVQQAIVSLTEARVEFIKVNPIVTEISGSTINQTITSTVSINQQQTVKQSTKSTMQESVKAIATATALDTVNTKKGAGLISDNERLAVIDVVNKAVNKQVTNINESIEGNNLTVTNDNEITLSLFGNLRNTTINQGLNSMTNVVVTQVVEKAMQIGRAVAAEYISTSHTETTHTTIQTGTEDVIAALGVKSAADLDAMMMKNSDLAEVVAAAGKNMSDLVKTFGDVGASWMSLAMIPLIIMGVVVIAALFIVPQFITPENAEMLGLSPGVMKVVVIGALLALAGYVGYFHVYPIYKEHKAKQEAAAALAETEEGAGAEHRYSAKVNTPAPRQQLGTNRNRKQSLHQYVGRESRYAGSRTARKILSATKINRSKNYNIPTPHKHVNMYTVGRDSKDISNVHNHTVHIQNKKEFKPVMYTRG